MTADCGPGDFVKWAWAVVNRQLGPDHPQADDIVNEMLIAMWRAEETFNPALGAKASWLVKAAEMRFRALAFGKGQPFGHVSSRQRPVEEIHADRLAPAVQEKYEPRDPDFAEGAMWAYHRGEIAAAIDLLSRAQQQSARRVMNDEVMTGADRANWTVAKKNLRVSLAHLEDY